MTATLQVEAVRESRPARALTPAMEPSAGPTGSAGLALGEIQSPGAYILMKYGLLLRVPPEALLAGRSPVLTLTGRDVVRVAKISDSPWVPVGTARRIAANLDFEVDF